MIYDWLEERLKLGLEGDIYQEGANYFGMSRVEFKLLTHRCTHGIKNV